VESCPPLPRSLDVRACTVVVVVAAVVAAGCHADPHWQALTPGLSRQQSRLDDVAVVAFRADLSSWKAEIASAPRRKRVSDVVPARDHVAVNASFFDPDDKAMGYVVDAAGPHGRPLAGWGALAFFRGSSRVLAPGADLPSLPATALVQGLPRLVVDGAIVDKLKPQTAVRTAVCADDGFVTVVVTRGAVESTAFARHLKKVVGCKSALNLDGGPSTQLSVKAGRHLETVTGGWGVPNVLLLTPRQ
jgi:hypothetical protein